MPAVTCSQLRGNEQHLSGGWSQFGGNPGKGGEPAADIPLHGMNAFPLLSPGAFYGSNTKGAEGLQRQLGASVRVFSISAIRCHEGYLFWHSVDVATVSLLVAMASGYDREKMQELGVGALLHDIGDG